MYPKAGPEDRASATSGSLREMRILRSSQTYRIRTLGMGLSNLDVKKPDVHASLRTTGLCHKLSIKFNTDLIFKNLFDSIK